MPPDSELPRQFDEAAAIPRLSRLGAQRFEAVRLRLRAYPLGTPGASPSGWLLCHREARRALLWPGELPESTGLISTETLLAAGETPSPGRVKRLWFWERLATRRLRRAQLQVQAPRWITLPLWLGYSGDRGKRRLIVISGVSGEALVALKPVVLAGLREMHAPA